MRKSFVAAAKAHRKLQFAEGSGSAVYLFGATGYGKTKLIREYLGKKNALWLSSLEREWDLSTLDGAAEDGVFRIVADDMHLLRSEDQKQQLLALAQRDDVWLVMLGRMQTPLWLMPLIADGRLVVISEEDLHLTTEEIVRIAENEAVTLEKETAEIIARDGCGNAYIAASVIQLMKSGEVFTADMSSSIHTVFVRHLENDVIPQWSIGLQEFLMQLSVVDSFTLPLAVMITGDNHAPAMLEQALAAGNFLRKTGETYSLRPQLTEALRARALKVFGVQKYRQYINNAGLYYETQNDFLTAISLYEASGNKDGIRALLIRSARCHPGAGELHALRRRYLSLEEEEIATSPVLMSAMSMLHSVMMNTEKSEYWYGKLKEYAASAQGGERREADEQLLYLDIGLPHRETLDLLDTAKRAIGLIRSGGLSLPELSVTNNQPSTMNGGKDFCDWSRHDQFLADTAGKLVEELLGPFGRGLTHAALCESFYEKGGRDEEVLHHAIMLQMEVESGGKTELLFASVGIQVRLDLLAGDPLNAARLLDSFEERARKEERSNLLANIAALRCRIALAAGDMQQVEKWLETAPDERMEFWSLDRYAYLTKVRCYLALGQNRDAISLLKRLLYYAEVSKRPYVRMESKLLLAMALRQEKQEWKSILTEALSEIQSYAFVRIISEKGAGILPLLRESRREYSERKGADKAWLDRVIRETELLAERYPGYLVSDAAQPRDFCDTALTVLRMQAEGYSIKEIAVKLAMSERTVKYHAAENYRKLGAKGKTDAVQIARSLNLI